MVARRRVRQTEQVTEASECTNLTPVRSPFCREDSPEKRFRSCFLKSNTSSAISVGLFFTLRSSGWSSPIAPVSSPLSVSPLSIADGEVDGEESCSELALSFGGSLGSSRMVREQVVDGGGGGRRLGGLGRRPTKLGGGQREAICALARMFACTRSVKSNRAIFGDHCILSPSKRLERMGVTVQR